MRRVCVTLFEAARWKHESTLVYGCVRITRGIQFCALPVPIVGTPRPILAVTDRHRFCAWCPVHLTGMSDLQCTKFVTTGVGVLVSLLGASRDENSEKRGGSLSLRLQKCHGLRVFTCQKHAMARSLYLLLDNVVSYSLVWASLQVRILQRRLLKS
jgi:hypothetical protein